MTKIYLDTCSIQRPLDTLSQTRLRLEAEAILGVLTQVKAGNVELISSIVLELETQRNLLAIRREHGEQILAQATSIAIVNEQIEQSSLHFMQIGIKILDALHLAAAEAAGADYFCTCDDRFYGKQRQLLACRRVLFPHWN
ncbi:MAG: PIN domain-containing protein [Chloroflexi bacterium]|nr:PIN domain-containing protein [Chloroflexota bacterium]